MNSIEFLDIFVIFSGPWQVAGRGQPAKQEGTPWRPNRRPSIGTQVSTNDIMPFFSVFRIRDPVPF
jgi:hypothetical protein